MENRNFHTALIGGFRKKDVISYMAEEKRQQEELLEELRSSQTELERQLEDARLSDDSNRLLSEDLQEEVDTLRQRLEQANSDLAACQEARLLAEEQMSIGSIGRSCGFDNASYFARTFSSIVGCTPMEYREKKKKL